MRDRGKEKRVKEILEDPTLFPDEFLAWLPRAIENNPTLRIPRVQLPLVDSPHVVGVAGEPVFLGAWENFDPAVAPASYYRDPWERVFLAGAVASGTGDIYELPYAYRPQYEEVFVVETDSGPGRVRVSPSGAVEHEAGGTDMVQLSGISFRAYRSNL